MGGSLLVLAIFVTGICIGMSGVLPVGYLPGGLGEWLLYALIIQIGMTLGYDGSLWRTMRKVPLKAMLLPLCTLVGTLLFTAIAGLFLGGWSLPDYLAIGSGMGYYSLSSVLIVELKSDVIGLQAATQLGMLALLVNIIREITALVCGPWIAKWFGRYAVISAAGVTSMDVTLPMIIRCAGREIIPIAFMHGLLLDISVPVLVTLFAGL